MTNTLNKIRTITRKENITEPTKWKIQKSKDNIKKSNRFVFTKKAPREGRNKLILTSARISNQTNSRIPVKKRINSNYIATKKLIPQIKGELGGIIVFRHFKKKLSWISSKGEIKHEEQQPL